MDPLSELQAKGRERINRLIELGKQQPEPVQTWGVTAAAAAGGALVLTATTQGVLAVAAALAAPPVVLTVGVVGGGLAGWSYFKNRKAAAEQAAREGTALPPPTSLLPAWLRPPWLQREVVTQALAPRFRAWVERDLGSEAHLQQWLLSLSPDQLQLLVKHLLTHCEQLCVELNWLLEEQPDGSTDLKQAVHEIVVGYCTSVWKAVQMKPVFDQVHTSGDQAPNPPPEAV